MRKVLTFGITQEQQKIITDAVSDKYDVVDVTACFTDLIAIPAEAVVICPSKLSSDSIKTFNEVFGEDYDTWVVFTEKPNLNIEVMYTLECEPETMWNTIEALQGRYELPEQVKEAYNYKEDVLKEIKEIFEPDRDLSMRDKMARIYNCCTPYTYINKIVEHIPDLKLREKVPYRYELNHILLAVMLAHDLVERDNLFVNLYMDGVEIEDNKEAASPFISYDVKWICSLSDLIHDHYRKVLQKNNMDF